MKQKSSGPGSSRGKSPQQYQTAEEWMQQKYSPEKMEGLVTQANSWIDRYNKVITGFSDFDKQRNGGYTKDVGGGYGEEIWALLRDFEGFQDYLGVLGFTDAMRYVGSLRKLQKGIDKENQFMSQFADEEAYNANKQIVDWYQKYQGKSAAELSAAAEQMEEGEEKDWLAQYASAVDQEEMLHLDLGEAQAEIDDLIAQQEDYAWNHEFDWTDAAQRMAHEAHLADLDDQIAQKKQRMNRAKDIQGQEQLRQQSEELLKKYQGKSYSELKAALEQTEDGSFEKAWLEQYAPSVMGKDDYVQEVSQKTAELEYLEDGRKKMSDQIIAGIETEADKEKYDALLRQYGSPQDLKKQIEALKSEIWNDQNAMEYNFLKENEDYAQMSRQQGDVKKAGFGIGLGTKWWGQGDPVYHYINDIDGARDVHPAMKGKMPYSIYDYMTEEDVANYNYLYNTQGKEAAQDYLDYLSYELENSQMETLQGNTAAYATQHPILSSALSVGTNLTSGIGALDIAGQNLAREITGEYKPIHYERSSMVPTVVTSTTRGTVAQNIADATGAISLNEDDHPFWSRVLNGKSLGDVYQLGMSMADSGAIALMTMAGIPGGTALLGGSAASQGVLDALEKGANDEQALTMGILNGTFEMLFEKVSLDKLVNGNTGKLVHDILVQGGVEGSEEFFTTLANTAADILVMADKSGVGSKIEKYMKEEDLDREQATIKALEDVAIDLGWDFMGGLLSGGMMRGMVQPVHTFQQGVGLKNAGITGEQLSQLGGTFSNDSRTGKMAGKVGSNSGAFNMGGLYNRISTELSGQNTADIQKALEDKGMDKSIAKKHAQILETIVEGGTLSDTQMRMIEKNEILSQVMEEIVRNPDSVVNQRTNTYSQILQQVESSGVQFGADSKQKWRNAAEYAKGGDLNAMEALNQAGLSGSVDLAKANPQAYARSFQEAMKSGASYDQALIQATSESTMKVLGTQIPMSELLYNIDGDTNKAVSIIRDATARAGINMTPGELNLLGIVAAEASAYQRDHSFQNKVALEMLKVNSQEEAWNAASEKLWSEAADRAIKHGVANLDLEGKEGQNQQTVNAISRDIGQMQPMEAIATEEVEDTLESPTYEELVQKEDIPVIDIGRNTEGKTYAQLKADVSDKADAQKWYDTPHTNKDTGMPVFLVKKSLTHAFSNLSAQFGTDTILAMGKAPELIQNAVLVNIAPPKNQAKPETRVFTFFAAINGENGIEPVKLTVKEFSTNTENRIPEKIAQWFEKVKRSKTYNSLYDLKALEVIEIETAKKEFGASANDPRRQSQSGAKSTPNSTISVSDLMALVKGDAEKYIPKRKKSAEKVDSLTSNEQEAHKTSQKPKKGKVHYEGNIASLTKDQRTNLKGLEVISNALGVDIYVFEGKTAPDGVTRIGANGWYDTSDGSIHIDLYAGADGKGTMLFTAAHELTHFIRDQSPEKFQALSDFLMEQYGKKDVSIQELVENQMAKAKKAGHEIDYDGAFEEVVADSMESMLADGKVLQELKNQNRGLWETVKDYFQKLCEKIRKAYMGLEPDSEEGRMVAQMRDAAEEMQRLFTEGLLDAGENHQGVTGKEKDTNEGSMRYSFKGYDPVTGKGVYEGNFPKGTPKSAKAERILTYIQNVWSKKPIDLVIRDADGRERVIQAQFDPTYNEKGGYKSDASKLMGGNRHGTSSEQRVTLDLADDYYQLASEAVYNYSKPETGKDSVTHQGVNNWYYFINDILFQEYGETKMSPYRVTINVKEKTDGNFVYSFSAERQKES